MAGAWTGAHVGTFRRSGADFAPLREMQAMQLEDQERKRRDARLRAESEQQQESFLAREATRMMARQPQQQPQGPVRQPVQQSQKFSAAEDAWLHDMQRRVSIADYEAIRGDTPEQRAAARQQQQDLQSKIDGFIQSKMGGQGQDGVLPVPRFKTTGRPMPERLVNQRYDLEKSMESGQLEKKKMRPGAMMEATMPSGAGDSKARRDTQERISRAQSEVDRKYDVAAEGRRRVYESDMLPEARRGEYENLRDAAERRHFPDGDYSGGQGPSMAARGGPYSEGYEPGGARTTDQYDGEYDNRGVPVRRDPAVQMSDDIIGYDERGFPIRGEPGSGLHPRDRNKPPAPVDYGDFILPGPGQPGSPRTGGSPGADPTAQYSELQDLVFRQRQPGSMYRVAQDELRRLPAPAQETAAESVEIAVALAKQGRFTPDIQQRLASVPGAARLYTLWADGGLFRDYSVRDVVATME